VNADKTKYMIMSVDQNAERSQYVKTDDGSFKLWTSSNTCEQLKQINILLRKKLRGDGSQRMFIIRCRILCLPVPYSKLSYTDL
jgi:hypothetical protein